MHREFEKIRKIAKSIESGNASFSQLYAYLDKVQTPREQSDSEDEIDMQKYIKPVKKMLNNYKKSIKTVKEHNQVIEQALKDKYRDKQNSYEGNSKTKTKKIKVKNIQAISMQELDDEIGALEKKIRMMR